MGLRVFAAVVPPEDVVEHLDHFLDPRRDTDDGLRWTRPEHLHITLAFMESVEQHLVDPYVDRLADGLSGTPIPDLRLGGAVAFPDVASARALALGVRPVSEAADVVLERMAGRARNAAVVSGVEVDGGRFRPHLTVARLRQKADVSRWVHVLDTYDGPSWPVYEVAVIASHLGEGPNRTPRYETLAEIPL
ncbi:RNA 2',3'-cyclic phosphodiesterase [Nocardioides ultimimeridianus]